MEEYEKGMGLGRTPVAKKGIVLKESSNVQKTPVTVKKGVSRKGKEKVGELSNVEREEYVGEEERQTLEKSRNIDSRKEDNDEKLLAKFLPIFGIPAKTHVLGQHVHQLLGSSQLRVRFKRSPLG